MKRSAILLLVLVVVALLSAKAQVVESADVRPFTINAGGTATVVIPNDGSQPLYGSGASYLIGIGTYADLHFTHWVQLEGEARWLRFNQYAGEHMDTYLVGPKVPVFRFRGADVYGKAMIGVGKMTFPNKYGYGTFTALAFGGGVDYRLSRKLTFRAADFEYQDWPKFLPNFSIHPYSISMGMSYRVF
jgi:hypothetical protein